MSHLIAHGHPEAIDGTNEPQQSLGHIFLDDDGGITVTVEGETAATDLVIKFPPSSVDDNARRRIRGRS